MNNYLDFKAFRKDVEAALSEVSKKYGINIASGNIRYDETSFTMQLKCERADMDVAKQNFISNLRYMKYLGFEEDDYLRAISIDGNNYTITGFKPGNKYNVCLERADGKGYAFTSDAVLLALGRKENSLHTA